MPTRTLFNARTQQDEDADFSVDHNNEIVGRFADGGIKKFPAGLNAEQFEELIARHKEANTGQVVITEELLAEQAAARNASLALIGEAEAIIAEQEPDGNADQPDNA